VNGVDGRKVMFSIQAWDAHELIAGATHPRFVVDSERFMRRVENKRQG
jgi:predicted thioesterase